MLRVAFLNNKSKILYILKTIKNYVGSKKVRQYLVNYENISAREVARRLTIFIAASIYSTDLNDFCEALNNISELKLALGVSKQYNAKTIQYTTDQIPKKYLHELLLNCSSYIIKKERINLRYIVIDGRKQQSFLNPKNKAINAGKDPDAKWGKSTTKGWIFGYNTVFVYDPFSGLFLNVKVYPANVSDVKVFKEVLMDVKRKFKAKNVRVLADKGFLANYNIVAAIRDLEMVPYIIPRRNTKLQRLLCVYADFDLLKLGMKKYQQLFIEMRDRVRAMNRLYNDQKRMKRIRKMIEHVFSRFQYIFDLRVIKTLSLATSTNYILSRTWAFNLIVLTSHLEDLIELRTFSKAVFS